MPSAVTDILITCVFLWATIKAGAFKKQRETLDFHSRLPLNIFRALAASWVIYNRVTDLQHSQGLLIC